MEKKEKNLLFGVVARFATSDALLAAAEKVRDAGYTKTDAYTPIPVHGLPEALGMKKSRMSLLVLIGGSLGCLGGLALQYWISVVTYPHIVSGKPFFSWPSFVPVIFECTVLGAALSGVFGLLIRNRLPQPFHPVFSTPQFDRGTSDRFFLSIEAEDPKFNETEAKQFLSSLGAEEVSVVDNHPDDPEIS